MLAAIWQFVLLLLPMLILSPVYKCMLRSVGGYTCDQAPAFVFNISIWANSKIIIEPTAHILHFPLSLFAFHGDKMNSALNLINPQRFHVLIPKVKGVIVLTNEVSVPPSGNKGKKEQNTETKGRDHGCLESGESGFLFSAAVLVE